MRFEWDEKKNTVNRTKHGVWFEEAQQVFDDPSALLFYDKDHSSMEERFILLGSSSTRVLIVVHCEKEKGVVRIISARKAKAKERKRYEEGI